MPKINTGGVDKSVHEEITSITFDHEGAHLAAVHALQQPANGCPDALIFKADESDEELTKALEQITVTMSMEEYLRKYMNMYHSDAEMLTMMMGMMTEYEYYMEEESEPMTHKEYMQMKMDKIKILDSNMMDIERSTYADLPEDVRDAAKCTLTALFKSFAEDEERQEMFEQYVVEKVSTAPSDAIQAEEKTEETIQSSSSTESLNKTTTNGNQKETITMPKTTTQSTEGTATLSMEDILKSADFAELLKAKVDEATAKVEAAKQKDLDKAAADLEKATARVEALEKAEQERIEKTYTTFATKLGFLGEDEVVGDLVKAIMTLRNTDVDAASTVVTALDKAKKAIDAATSNETGFSGHNEVEKSSDVLALDALIDQMVADQNS